MFSKFNNAIWTEQWAEEQTPWHYYFCVVDLLCESQTRFVPAQLFYVGIPVYCLVTPITNVEMHGAFYSAVISIKLGYFLATESNHVSIER